MTPVISPWVFYLMAVVDDLQSGLMFALFAGIGFGIWALIEHSNSYSEDEAAKCIGYVKKACVAVITVAIMLALIPGSKTITKMLIAQNVTYERVEVAADTVQRVYEDIMGLFEEDEHE